MPDGFWPAVGWIAGGLLVFLSIVSLALKIWLDYRAAIKRTQEPKADGPKLVMPTVEEVLRYGRPKPASRPVPRGAGSSGWFIKLLIVAGVSVVVGVVVFLLFFRP